MWAATVLLCLAVGVHGQATGAEPQPVVQNAYLDEMISKLNYELNEWDFGMKVFPRNTTTIAGVKVSNGALLGLDSLHRTKDATEVKGVNESYFDVWLGARILHLGYEKIITPEGKRMSGLFRSRGNSFHIKALMDNSQSCKFNVSHFEFETLGEVMLDSSLPEYDGKNVTDFFAKEVLPVLNSMSEEKKTYVEKVLQWVCENDKLPTDSPLVTYVIKLITTALTKKI